MEEKTAKILKKNKINKIHRYCSHLIFWCNFLFAFLLFKSMNYEILTSYQTLNQILQVVEPLYIDVFMELHSLFSNIVHKPVLMLGDLSPHTR